MVNHKRKALRRLLRGAGWLIDNSEDVIDAVKRFQDFFGLKPDGDVGPKTMAALEAPRFCRHDMPSGMGVRKWGKTQLTYSITREANSGSIQDNVIFDEFDNAITEIESHCSLEFDYTREFRSADIQIHFGSNMGGQSGPGSVLADSHLPPTDPVIQRYDRAEKWSNRPDSGIWLYLVALHEMLHAVGLEHVSPRAARAVVNPIYDPSLDKLQSYDIEQLVARYGEPDQDMPTEPGSDPNTIVINNPAKIVIYK